MSRCLQLFRPFQRMRLQHSCSKISLMPQMCYNHPIICSFKALLFRNHLAGARRYCWRYMAIRGSGKALIFRARLWRQSWEFSTPGGGSASVIFGSEIFQPYLLIFAEVVVVGYKGEKSAVCTKLRVANNRQRKCRDWSWIPTAFIDANNASMQIVVKLRNSEPSILNDDDSEHRMQDTSLGGFANPCTHAWIAPMCLVLVPRE